MIKYFIDYNHLASYNFREASYSHIDHRLSMEIIDLVYHCLINTNQNMVDKHQI